MIQVMADVMLCALACPHCPPSTGAVVLVGGGITGADISTDAAAGCLVCGKKVPPGDAAASLEAAYMGWAMTRQALLSLVRRDATPVVQPPWRCGLCSNPVWPLKKSPLEPLSYPLFGPSRAPCTRLLLLSRLSLEPHLLPLLTTPPPSRSKARRTLCPTWKSGCESSIPSTCPRRQDSSR